MNVYILFHADIEDDRYVRGVYSRREDGEAAVTAKEWSDNWIIERAARDRMARGRVPDGHRPAGTQRWEYPPGTWHERPSEAVWNFRYFRTHGDWCCGVEEWPVQDEAPAVEYGPFPQELIEPNLIGLVPAAMEEMILRHLIAPAFSWRPRP